MARGRLRIYLGAAPGVGKTYAMLNEGWRRQQRGSADVVAGYVETHGRAETAAQIRDLEVIPRRTITYRDREYEEMDVDAILARAPDVALVDELAHTNVPGSRNEKRWQDVEELLEAGVEVITTVNLQHLESMNDVVEAITGIRQQERIPDAIVRSADQIELTDMSPEALRRRMAHGNIYPADKIDTALANYFRVGNLGALRELALLWVADRVDEALERYRVEEGIAEPWETRERVVVAMTGAPGSEHVVRRAARMAARSNGVLLGVHVRSSEGLREAAPTALAEQQRLLRELGGEYHELAGGAVADALVRFARAENATQIVLGASRRSRLAEMVRGSVIAPIVRTSGPIDVHVISHGYGEETGAELGRRIAARRPRLFERRRVLLAWIAALAGPVILTAALAPVRGDLGLHTVLLLFLLIVVLVALLAGILPAALAALAGFLLSNWYFTPPPSTLRIASTEDVVALGVFVVVAIIVGIVVDAGARRAAAAARARAEAETLAAIAGSFVGVPDPLPGMLEHLRTMLGATSVAVLRREHFKWTVEAFAGSAPPMTPHAAALWIELTEDEVLVAGDRDLTAESPEILSAFVGRVAAAAEQRHLRALADTAGGLAEANELRSALLSAVSHELRTPLASIKASVTSLLQRGVTLRPAEQRELLETIAEGTDRLDALVGNLLDMSRLQAGAVEPLLVDVGVDEIVARALTGLGERAGTVEVDVPESLPAVRVDAALLERAVTNLLTNAIRWSPDGAAVWVDASKLGSDVVLRVIDHGPGIAPRDRERLFEPFQRGLGESGSGTGLGLAIARGFVEAMGGRLTTDETPGGGTTMEISLPARR